MTLAGARAALPVHQTKMMPEKNSNLRIIRLPITQKKHWTRTWEKLLFSGLRFDSTFLRFPPQLSIVPLVRHREQSSPKKATCTCVIICALIVLLVVGHVYGVV